MPNTVDWHVLCASDPLHSCKFVGGVISKKKKKHGCQWHPHRASERRHIPSTSTFLTTSLQPHANTRAHTHHYLADISPVMSKGRLFPRRHRGWCSFLYLNHQSVLHARALSLRNLELKSLMMWMKEVSVHRWSHLTAEAWRIYPHLRKSPW